MHDADFTGDHFPLAQTAHAVEAVDCAYFPAGHCVQLAALFPPQGSAMLATVTYFPAGHDTHMLGVADSLQ